VGINVHGNLLDHLQILAGMILLHMLLKHYVYMNCGFLSSEVLLWICLFVSDNLHSKDETAILESMISGMHVHVIVHLLLLSTSLNLS
jgi:hypothetical protein